MPYPPFTAPLTLATLAAQLSSAEAVRLSPEAEQRMLASQPPATTESQAPAAASLLLAYAVGTGAEVPAPLVRRMLLLLAHRLSQGPAGGALATGRRLLDFYNREVWPVVYEQGALGAAGNHIPLAHLALPLLGLGEVNYQGYRLAAADVLELFGWAPLVLGAPEVRVLLGGHEFGLAYATEALARTAHLGRAAAAIGALTAAASGGALGGQPGVGFAAFSLIEQAIESACQATSTSELPPVVAAQTLASATHALPAALSQLAREAAAVGASSAQRTAQLVAGPATGLELRALPLAAASLVGHSQRLSAAAGVGAAEPGTGLETATRQVVENTEQLLGIELLAAAQALDLRRLASPAAAAGSPALAKVFAAFRAHVTFAAPGRLLAPDLHRAARFVREFAWE